MKTNSFFLFQIFQKFIILKSGYKCFHIGEYGDKFSDLLKIIKWSNLLQSFVGCIKSAWDVIRSDVPVHFSFVFVYVFSVNLTLNC